MESCVPKTLEDLDYNHEVTDILKRLSNSIDFPNLMFYGVTGAGKRTRIMCFLQSLFGDSVYNPKQISKSFKVKSKYVEVKLLVSGPYTEFSGSQVGVYDHAIIQDLIKEIAETSSFKKWATGAHSTLNRAPKVILISEADQLSRNAQHALRRTMELYSKTVRVILSCESFSKIIEPIRSRVFSIRVPAASSSIVQKITGVPNCNSLTRALLSLKTGKTLLSTTPEWELYIQRLAKLIKVKQTTKAILDARERLTILLNNYIPPDVIFMKLSQELLKLTDDDSETSPSSEQIIHWATHYELRSVKGQKPIYFLEAYVVKMMSLCG